jgi:hypothetical protein
VTGAPSPADATPATPAPVDPPAAPEGQTVTVAAVAAPAEPAPQPGPRKGPPPKARAPRPDAPSRSRPPPPQPDAPAKAPPPASKPAAPPKYTGPDPCKHATKGSNPIVAACAEGGIRKAKVTMRTLVRQAKAAGVRFDCDDCHKDDADYSKMTADAHDKLDKLLAAAGSKK